MLHALARFLQQVGASDEASAERDGVLSTHTETHALAVGCAAGYLAQATDDQRLLELVLLATTAPAHSPLHDVARERAYALTGAVAGHLLARSTD